MRRSYGVSTWLFSAALILLSIEAYEPLSLKAHPKLLENLLSGSAQGYIQPGSELEPFKPFLPPQGTVSFLTDHPFGDSLEEEKLLYDAQGFLAPLVLRTQPGESLAVLFCSSDAVADGRLAAAGYQWLQKISEGKGIAQK